MTEEAQTERQSMDEAFFIQALDENRETIKAHIRDTIIKGITRKYEWELPEAISKAVSEFMVKEIAPEIQKQLLADKALIVEAATQSIRGLTVEIGKALQSTAAKNMTSSYNVGKLVEAIFK